MTDIREQIKQLRASRPIDQRSDTGWDDLSSVRFQIAHTMEKMLVVIEAGSWLASEVERDHELDRLSIDSEDCAKNMREKLAALNSTEG